MPPKKRAAAPAAAAAAAAAADATAVRFVFISPRRGPGPEYIGQLQKNQMLL